MKLSRCIFAVCTLIVEASIHPSLFALDNIQVGNVVRSYASLPHDAAVEQRFFEREGLLIQNVSLGNVTRIIQAQIAGSIDLGVNDPSGVIAAVEAGQDFKAVAGINNSAPYTIIGVKGMKNLREIEGKAVAVSGLKSGSTVLLTTVIELATGLKYPRDYTLLEVGGTPDRLAALQTGRVAATILLGAAATYKAIDAGSTPLATVSDYVPEFQWVTVNAAGSWLRQEKYQDLLVRYLKGIIRATDWIYKNREAAILLGMKLTGLDRKYVEKEEEEFFTRKIFPVGAKVTEKGFQTLTDMMWSGVLGKSGPPPSFRKYVDLQYLEKAAK